MNERERAIYLQLCKERPWAAGDFNRRVAQALAFAEERKMEWPKCTSCNKGVMLPLSDFGPEGSAVLIKAWACTNRLCRYTVRIDKGIVSYEYAKENHNVR